MSMETQNEAAKSDPSAPETGQPDERHVPGLWQCPQCRFQTMRNVLQVSKGTIVADGSPMAEPCPNDGQTMEPVTWQAHCVTLATLAEQLLEHRQRYDRALARLVGSDDRPELLAMRTSVKLMTRPGPERDAMVGAIDMLLEARPEPVPPNLEVVR